MLLARLFKKLFILGILAILMLVIIGVYYFQHRPGMTEYNMRLIKESAWSGLRMRWLGTASILLDDGETQLLIDPYFSRPSLASMFTSKVTPQEKVIQYWLDVLGVKKLDAVLVSHSHLDHSLDAPYIAKQTNADILGSASTANIARGEKVDEAYIKTVELDKPYHYGKFTITFIESTHGGILPHTEVTKPLTSPAWAFQYGMGDVYSILIEHPEGSVLHHASAGFFPGHLENYHADTVLLGIALRPELTDYIDNVVKTTGANTVIPIHWDDFSIPLTQPQKPLPAIFMDNFFDDMQTLYPNIKVRTMPFNVPVKPYAKQMVYSEDEKITDLLAMEAKTPRTR